MRTWRPVFSFGGWIAFLLALIAWVLGAVMASMLLAPVSGRTFWLALATLLLLAGGAFFLYQALAAFTMRYVFDRNGLTLYWGWTRQVVPMNRITAVRFWEEGEKVRERGLRWPGMHRGHARSESLGAVEFYATAGRPAQVLVCTAEGSYVLSPRQPRSFVEELELRRSLGITRQLAQERQYGWLLGLTFWRDRPMLLIAGLALVLNLTLWAFLCYLYPTLDPLLPIHFSEVTVAGQSRIEPDFIAPASDLFKLPAFGLLLLGANVVLGVLLHRRHRLLAVMLGAVGLLVQAIFWVGMIYILTH